MTDKRYYWLKLKRDFFKRHDIRIIESMPNGKDYILFYLKLLCESVDHEGNLRFSEQIPYNEEMLSTITNTNVDIVRSAIKIFTELHMMDIMDDGTYFMHEVERMIGSASQDENTRESTRLRVQAFRERKKQALIEGKCYSNVTCNGEKEIEKDIEIEKDKEKERINYQSIVDMYNEICISFPSLRSLSDARKKAIKARLKTYSLEDFKRLFEKAEASSFLKGGNDRNWTANFDWLMKDSNFAKVLDGNYDNKPNNRGGRVVPVPDYIVDQMNGVEPEFKPASKESVERVKKLLEDY